MKHFKLMYGDKLIGAGYQLGDGTTVVHVSRTTGVLTKKRFELGQHIFEMAGYTIQWVD